MAVDKNYRPRVAASMMPPDTGAIQMEPHMRVSKLTAAQIITLNSVPVVLVPGMTGWYTILVAFFFSITRTSTAFTGGGVLSLKYDTAGTAAHTSSIVATVVTGAAGTVGTLLFGYNPANGLTVPVTEGLALSCATADFAAGTGTALVTTFYRRIKQ